MINDVSGEKLYWRPEDSFRLLRHVLGQHVEGPVLHALCHAMFNTRRLKPVPGPVGAQGTEVGWNGYEGKIRFIGWELLNDFEYLDAAHPCGPLVFLGAGNLTRIAAGAILVVD
jgi:hypothetical protein